MKWLHDCWTEGRQKALQALLLERGGRDAIREQWKAIPEEYRAWLSVTLAEGRLPTVCVSAFAVPVLSQEACRHIVKHSEDYPWTDNPAEDEAYRIPEAVLEEVDPVFDQEVKTALFAGLAPWTIAIWGRLPDRFTSVQLTRYNPRGRDGGAYHIDATSDYTAVIALNHDFTGGGTAIVDGLLAEVSIPPLPIGYALVFDGKRTLHKGLTVEQGDRRLLTVWADNHRKTW